MATRPNIGAQWLVFAIMVLGAGCSDHLGETLAYEAELPGAAVGLDDADLPVDYHSIHYGYMDRLQPPGLGACGYGPADGALVGAINGSDFHRSAACGASVRVYGPGGSVTVRVVDRCEDCDVGGLRLSKQALDLIAPGGAGWIGVHWHFVESLVGGAMQYRRVPATAARGEAIHVSNHRHPIAAVHLADAGAPGFVELSRTPDNYFVAPPEVTEGPYTLRIRDVFGHEVEEVSVELPPLQSVTGDEQLPPLAEEQAIGVPSTAAPETLPGISVTVQPRQVWDLGFCAEVLVRNDASTELEWYANVPLEGSVVGVSRCKYTIDGDVMTLYGKPDNATLPPGKTTDCGFCATTN